MQKHQILGADNDSIKSNSKGITKQKYSNVKRKPLYHVPSSKRSLSPIQQDLQVSINDLQRLYPTMKFSETAPSNGNNLPAVASHRIRRTKKANILVL